MGIHIAARYLRDPNTVAITQSAGSADGYLTALLQNRTSEDVGLKLRSNSNKQKPQEEPGETCGAYLKICSKKEKFSFFLQGSPAGAGGSLRSEAKRLPECLIFFAVNRCTGRSLRENWERAPSLSACLQDSRKCRSQA